MGRLRSLRRLVLRGTAVDAFRLCAMLSELGSLRELDVAATPAVDVAVHDVVLAVARSLPLLEVLDVSRSPRAGPPPADISPSSSSESDSSSDIEPPRARRAPARAVAAAAAAVAAVAAARAQADADDSDSDSGDAMHQRIVFADSGTLAAAMTELCARCTMLRSVKLAFCGVGDNAVLALASLPALAALDVSGNGAVSGRSLAVLAARVPLARLLLVACPGVRTAEAQELSARGVLVVSRGLCTCRHSWHMAGCPIRRRGE
jgi:hypothetical protein